MADHFCCPLTRLALFLPGMMFSCHKGSRRGSRMSQTNFGLVRTVDPKLTFMLHAGNYLEQPSS